MKRNADENEANHCKLYNLMNYVGDIILDARGFFKSLRLKTYSQTTQNSIAKFKCKTNILSGMVVAKSMT